MSHACMMHACPCKMPSHSHQPRLFNACQASTLTSWGNQDTIYSLIEQKIGEFEKKNPIFIFQKYIPRSSAPIIRFPFLHFVQDSDRKAVSCASSRGYFWVKIEIFVIFWSVEEVGFVAIDFWSFFLLFLLGVSLNLLYLGFELLIYSLLVWVEKGGEISVKERPWEVWFLCRRSLVCRLELIWSSSACQLLRFVLLRLVLSSCSVCNLWFIGVVPCAWCHKGNY